MWDTDRYLWVVICKNKWFHRRVNLYYGHKIPLGITDAFTPPPPLDGPFRVRCDSCGSEYSYDLEELLRLELAVPESFSPHALFR